MGTGTGDFLNKLLATFRTEAQEHIGAISSGLLALEKVRTAERRKETIETVFREAHSLKGAARAVNLVEIETICQSLENIFSACKRTGVAMSPMLFDTLHKAVDTLHLLAMSAEAGPTEVSPEMMTELVRELESAAREVLPASRAETASGRNRAAMGAVARGGTSRPEVKTAVRHSAEAAVPGPTVRIATAKLSTLLLQAEELRSARLASAQRAAELRKLSAQLAQWKKQRARVPSHLRRGRHAREKKNKQNGEAGLAQRHDREHAATEKAFEFLEWNDSFIHLLSNGLRAVAKLAEQDHRLLDGMVSTLLEDMKKVLMLPFSTVLDVLPKLVRDLARARGKEAELILEGGDVEIDRRILEEMKDPLIHLVRNGVDHGIEKPEERVKKQKPPHGKITVAVSQTHGDKAEIRISDDGAGIALDRVRAAAVKAELVSPEEAETLNEQAVLSLIFCSGVATSPIVTDLSGRGLGLAIVREKVEKLGGVVSVEQSPEAGTSFRIVLPLTLATFRGVLVRLDDYLFVLPSSQVERVIRVERRDIKTAENRETIQLNGQAVALVRLGDALELPRRSTAQEPTGKVHVAILGSTEKRIAFLVDEILGEQEVLAKNLGPHLLRARNVAGATVLGTGQVVPILSVPDLMRSAVRTVTTVSTPALVTEKPPMERRSILVAEDSITARTLLKNILESAGYRVRTAVDGLDALTALKTEDFDLVVSDVDMPRMSGFDLTATIRADRKLAELPVVLVTALESREDREHGIDAGANAYLVKSSFDQSNLLEVIQRLI